MYQWRKERLARPHDDSARLHPLYHLWFDRKQAGAIAEEWLDFWNFARDIGERPEDNWFLVRPDGNRPFGPDNWRWQEHLKRKPGESRKDWHARKWAARQAANPGLERRRNLKRKYGITQEEYDAMVLAHEGRCAICKQPETAVDPKTGSLRRLAIDHCHTSSRVRGLLCFRCNTVIGRIEEDVDLARAVIDYLLRYEKADAA